MASEPPSMNRIPGHPRLLIGTIDALDNLQALEDENVTHILSLQEYDYCCWPEYARFKYKFIEVADEVNQDALDHFTEANRFIDTALARRETVLVQCEQGISRSATFLAAYFMQKDDLTPPVALEIVRGAQPFISPNAGFMLQLDVWWQLLHTSSPAEWNRIYLHWTRQEPPIDMRDRVSESDDDSIFDEMEDQEWKNKVDIRQTGRLDLGICIRSDFVSPKCVSAVS